MLRQFILREFPLNSRHPGPRREKGGWRAAVQMPLPGDPGDPASSGRLYSMRRRVQIDTFARNWASNFRKIRENRPGHPKAPQGSPRGPQGIPKGPPRDTQGTPEETPRDPMGPQGVQGQPKGSQVGAKFKPKAPQSQSKGNQNKPRGQTIYQQTPDQPPARPLCLLNMLF